MLAENKISSYNERFQYFVSGSAARPWRGWLRAALGDKSKVFDPKIFDVLRCPLSQSQLSLAEEKLVEQINRGIEAGQIVNMAGHRLDRPLDAGLIREAGDVLYPVIDAIPVMLPDEAVDLSQLQGLSQLQDQ